LIHAARVSDPRPEAWARVPDELRPAAAVVGGIIGCGELIDCQVYRDGKVFAAHRDRHLNDPTWFQEPVMYGFVFENLKALPFRPLAGWMRFFPVPGEWGSHD
jgi:hypothetical protein